MNELNDFFKAMAEAKATDPKHKKIAEVKEHIKEDLGGLFSQISQIKAQDPVAQKAKKIEAQVKTNIKEDLGSLFAELGALKVQKDAILEERPELAEPKLEEPEVVNEEVLIEVAPLEEAPKPINVDKYLTGKTFQQPEPDPVAKEFKAITDKMKFLEQAIAKIAAHGPGSGEVNLRYLDDVDRATIGDGKYLNYNATTKKFQFSTLSGGGSPQLQSDWTQTDNSSLDFIKNKPTLFSGSYNDLTDVPVLSQIYTLNPNPAPATPFRAGVSTSIVSGSSYAVNISAITGLSGFATSKDWYFTYGGEIVFPDDSVQTTAWTGTYSYNDLTDKPTLPAAQIQSDWNQTTDTALDFIKNKPTIPDITGIQEVFTASGEPMGHEDRTQSTISFNESTRTFTIAPVGGSFEVWVTGTKHTFTTAQTVTIPDTTGLYYIYFDENGLGYQTDYFTWESQAPTALIYWNDVTNKAPYFADERHGTTLDWQTHEYLHRTRGAVIANGFSIGNYTIGGSVQCDIGDGTFFDEDLEVDVVHSNTPVANTWQQDLQGPAQIPMFYLSGTAWVRDNPTNYPVKQGASRQQYNVLSGGVWSTADIDANKYGATFIVATNNLTYPIIGIMSQSSHANQGEAEALDFGDLVLTGFPIAEFRLLYKLVFKVNTSHGQLTSVWDLRGLSLVTSIAAVGTDHGLLSGLGDDDHPQYLLRSDTGSITSVGTLSSLAVTYTPVTATGSAITLTGKDTQGGIGYFDFFKATNTTSGATNSNKTFRLSSTGAVEIINSAYTATLLSLSDAGALSVPAYHVNGKQAVNGPAFSAYADAVLQTIPNDTQTKVLFQTEEFDTNSNYASSRFTPTVEGYYQLNAEVRLDGASGTGEMMIILYKNGAEYKRGTNQRGVQIASNFWAMQVSSVAYANGTGDYFEIYVQQGSGATVSVTAVNNSAITWFNGCMLRGA